MRTLLLGMTLLGLTTATLLGLLNVSHAQEPTNEVESSDPSQLFEPREYVGRNDEVLKYRLLKPLDFDPNEKYPLVIFLHGAGERGDDNAAQLKHCMAEFCTPQRREQYPCYVLAPQCPQEQKWADVDWSADEIKRPESISPALGMTFEVVDSMLKDAAVDKRRIYIAGLSMGGYGTWDALARRPDFFAAAIPICGGGDPTTVEEFKHVPIWCFHGDEDPAVNVERSREMIEALKAAGGSPKYTEYPGVGHDSWTRTFENEETFAWLFDQRQTSTSRQ